MMILLDKLKLFSFDNQNAFELHNVEMVQMAYMFV